MKLPVAVQLYSIREETHKDFISALKKVAEIGYKGVEFAGFEGLKAREIKNCLDSLGLKSAGAHIGIDELKNNIDTIIEYNLELENRYIVCPWFSYENKEDYLRFAEILQGIGEKCSEAGLQLCYHNHAHELKLYDGKYGLDILYEKTAKQNLKAELDTYWISYAGMEPVDYMKKYEGRTPLIHLKDMAASEEREFTEIGNGIIDIKAIAAQAEKNGAEWLIVEQDVCKREPLESIKISFENLKKMNLI